MNIEYFNSDKLAFRGIRRETLKFLEEYNKFIKENIKYKSTFEDFMIVLSNYLNKNGYSVRKITKWFKVININIQSLAKNIVLNKKDEVL